MAAAPPPAPSPRWILLSTAPRISATSLPGDASMAFPFPMNPPPSVSVLTLGPHISPVGADKAYGYPDPSVEAVDPAGFVLVVTPPRVLPPTTDDAAAGSSEAAPTIPDVPAAPRPTHWVIDVRGPDGATVHQVAEYPFSLFDDEFKKVGVIADPNVSGAFLLADYRFVVARDGDRLVDNTLVCFDSKSGFWLSKAVSDPPPVKNWDFDSVVPFNGKLWWIDSNNGIVSCDPFAEEPRMRYVALPDAVLDDKDDAADAAAAAQGGDSRYSFSQRFERGMAGRRFVQLSDGKFRCVHIRKAKQEIRGYGSRARARAAPTTITMHTLTDPETGEWTAHDDYKLTYADIWDSDSYKAAWLPDREDPVFALIHPEKPRVLYFFLNEQIFGFDMRAKETELIARAVPVDNPRGATSSQTRSRVLAWELPPAAVFNAAAAAAAPAERSGWFNCCTSIIKNWFSSGRSGQ